MATARRLHLRIDEPTSELLDRLQQTLNIPATSVIQLAIKKLAEWAECSDDD